MSDVIEQLPDRLRAMGHPVANLAATEIERLRAELADIKAVSGYQRSLGYDEGYRAAAVAAVTEDEDDELDDYERSILDRALDKIERNL